MAQDKRITQLDYAPHPPQGGELFAMVQDNVTYRYSFEDFAAWLIAGHGINRPPKGQNFVVDTDDTVQQLTGNLLVGASDPDSDPFHISRLRYHGVDTPFADGSFQTDYGIMFLNIETADWTFTLGPAARALTTGDVEHEIFTYTLDDDKGGLATQTLTITIQGTNSVPVVSSANGQTPMNVTLNGNLLYRLSFDYEPTPLQVKRFTIDGIAGTFTAGPTPVNISGVGTIAIQTNGDYTFVPADGFYGPVPTIVYVVADDENEVPAFLRLSVTPLIPGTRPILLYSDIESCPTEGGEGDKGGYMSVFAMRVTGTLGSTIKVKIGGIYITDYILLEDAVVATKWPIKRVAFRTGALRTLTPGRPYPIILEVGGQDSNANLNFIPNPGNIIYVSQSGNDSTAVIGDINHPFRMMQYPDRGLRSVYSVVRAGDQVMVRGGATDWTDVGYDTAWFRFRDPSQQGYSPDGTPGTGWINFMAYPGERVKYTTQGNGLKGGFQGPGSAFNGTCGDWWSVSNFQIEVLGGSSSDGAPINMQYNSERCRIVNNNFGPWTAGDSPHLNAACVTGQGNFISILGNHMHDIDGTVEQQNHIIYAGTSAYGWRLQWNWMHDANGGSIVQCNDSDGGTNQLNTKFGLWTGFTNMVFDHNWLENSAKYGFTFSDVGAYAGELDFMISNNVIIGTGLAPLRLNTTTATSSAIYCFNTIYDCNRLPSGSGHALVRNEGTQQTPGHVIRVYNNILAFGPSTYPGCGWFADYSGLGNGYKFSRNLYYPADQLPGAPNDSLAIIGDPKFVNAVAHDFHLQADSPACNAATQPLEVNLQIEDDWTGQVSRASGGTPDIGAFEFDQPTPYPTTNPTFSGGPKVGVATSVSVGSWGNSPSSYSRQFRVDNANVGSDVSGTGTASYTPTSSDVYKTLTCAVSATNSQGTTIYSLNIGVIAQGTGGPQNTSLPVVSGTFTAGTSLHCTTGSWSGSVSGYNYQWTRNATDILGATAADYSIIGADVGSVLNCRVKALNTTTGYGQVTSTNSTVTLPAAADPQYVQIGQHSLPSATSQPIGLPADATANNLIATFWGVWDNHSYNTTISDNQGHTTGASSWMFEDENNEAGSGNPSTSWAWLLSNQSGPYTQSLNTQASAGGFGHVVEVSGVNPNSVMDIPQARNTGSGDSNITLTGAVPNTKPNDLILVGVAIRGTTHTIDTPIGWFKAGATAFGGNMTIAVFYRKCSSIETFSFSTVQDGTDGWVASSLCVKGS